jgi:putative endonuclease
MRQYCVYILSSKRRTLYTGVTNDLLRRMGEHKESRGSKFATKYNINMLVYYECTGDVIAAIEREKQIKGWRRSKKVALIESMNPEWRDLYEDIAG